MFQSLTLVGYIGNAPELRYLPDGNPVTTFSLATSEKYKDKETTTWYRVSVFGNQAEACNTYLKKGSPVLVVGRLKPDPETGGPRIWSRDDGTSGANFAVTAQTVRFLPGGKSGGASDQDVGDLPF